MTGRAFMRACNPARCCLHHHGRRRSGASPPCPPTAGLVSLLPGI